MENNIIKEYYIDCRINIFTIKYTISKVKAKESIKEFNFNSVLKSCNYIALHDDPEVWVDAIYKWYQGELNGE